MSLKGQQALPSIYAASMDAASGVASLLRLEGNTAIEPPSDVDLAVYTYSNGISMDRHDSCIVTADRSFALLDNRFSRERSRLEDEYGLSSALYGTDVVTLDKRTGDYILSTSCGHSMPL